MMVVVLIAAVFLAVWGLVPRAVDPLLNDRWGTLPAVWISRGVIRYTAVVTLLAGIVTAPFAVAIILALKPVTSERASYRHAVRRLMAAFALAVGLAILHWPLDGLRIAWLLKDGSGVAFYHRYRVWPGEHVTPCLELVTPTGRSRSYPIDRNTHYQGFPELRTNASQTVIWFADAPAARVRHGGVWCSLNRTTGEFVAAGGPYPTGVSETSGFPPAR
jgi:hypothetical protein